MLEHEVAKAWLFPHNNIARWRRRKGMLQRAQIIVLPLVLSCYSIPQPQSTDAVSSDTSLNPPETIVLYDSQGENFAITSITPDRGPAEGGTRVEVTGRGFVQGSKVVFGGVVGSDIVVQNDTSIMATTPPHSAGLVDVAVVQPDGKTAIAKDAFFYEEQVIVSQITPSRGSVAGGSLVEVTGKGFLSDAVLLIGGKIAPYTHVVSDTHITALTPQNSKGFKDVVVFTSGGSGALYRGFEFLEPPKIYFCEPAYVLTNGEAQVYIRGTGFQGASSVSSKEAKVRVTNTAPDSILVTLEPTEKGPVTIQVSTDAGNAVSKGCVVAVDPEDIASKDVQILGVAPEAGSYKGGYTAHVVVRGIKEQDKPKVYFGNVEQKVVRVSSDLRVITCEIKGQAPGTVDVSLKLGDKTYTLANAFTFLPQVSLQSVVPSKTDAYKPTQIVLQGEYLNLIQALYVGIFPAEITSFDDGSALHAISQPSPPGIYDIIAFGQNGDMFTLPDAFVVEDSGEELLAISPSKGAIAGGTLVNIVGAGMNRIEQVLFGDSPAFIVDSKDPSRLIVRTPPGEAGLVDVSVKWRDSNITKTLKKAFTYFDPAGYFGGLFGDIIHGSVNVTVVDSSTRKRVENALVIVGSDPSTRYKGRTNAKGQVTLSGEDLMGPLDVTATKEDYSAFTFAQVDAENITFFLDSLVPQQGGGGGGTATPLPPGLIQGRVLGADKYVIAPPEPCNKRPLIYGSLCAPCADDSQCGGLLCYKGFCTSECQSSSDCPPTYDCYPLENGRNGCLPSPGSPEVRCFVTPDSIWSTNPNPGPGYLVTSERRYALSSRLGDVAVYCVGGVRSYHDGAFTPLVLGLRRHLDVQPAKILDGQDVFLDIPLDSTMQVRLKNCPSGASNPNLHSLQVAINLGSDGVLPLWDLMWGMDKNLFEISGLPRSFLGDLDGATLVLLGRADPPDTNLYPYSVSIVRDLVLTTPVWVQIKNGKPSVTEPLVDLDALSSCMSPQKTKGALISRDGKIFIVSQGLDFEPLTALYNKGIRACAFLDDTTLVTAGEQGIVQIIKDQSFAFLQSSSRKTIRSLLPVSAQSFYATGDGVLLYYDGQNLTEIQVQPSLPLYTMVMSPTGRHFLFGAKGFSAEVSGRKLREVAPWPSSNDLFFGATVANQVLVAGANGTLLVGPDGDQLKPLKIATLEDLLTIVPYKDGALVGGATGTLFLYENGRVSPISIASFDLDITAGLSFTDDEALLFTPKMATVGPFLYPPTFTEPLPSSFWASYQLSFTRSLPPAPSYTYIAIMGLKSSSTWEIVMPGVTTSIVLPDIMRTEGFSPMPSGSVRIRALEVLMKNFDFNRFDFNAFSSGSWVSWAVNDLRCFR